MTTFGVDYAWQHPPVEELKAKGVKFACRYLSHDTSGKNLTLAEAKQLTAAGIWIVVIWESTANRALVGRPGGVQDATDALAQAKACGMPDGRPIYFAVDWDANQAQSVRINAYLDGAASVLGVDRVGIYGGYGPVKRALDGGHATWAWSTYAWSQGKWDPRSHIQQYLNDQKIGGVGLDYDRATTDDYGQWKVGESPMSFTPKDAETLFQTDGILDNPVADKTNPKVRPGWLLTDTNRQVRQLQLMVAALGKGADVDEDAIVKGVLAGLAPATIAAAVVAALPADEAKKVVDELTARLAG